MNGASRWLEASAGAPNAAASVATVRLAAKSLSPRLLDGFGNIAITPRLNVDRHRRLGRWRVQATELSRALAWIGPLTHVRMRPADGCDRVRRARRGGDPVRADGDGQAGAGDLSSAPWPPRTFSTIRSPTTAPGRVSTTSGGSAPDATIVARRSIRNGTPKRRRSRARSKQIGRASCR